MPSARSIAFASTLAVDERVGAREGVVRHEHGPGGAHGQRGAQAGDLAVGGHRDQHDLAAARLVGELQGHLHAVGVGVVEDQLAGPLERVVSLELARDRRVGDLLHADCDVHSVSPRPGAPTNRSRRLMT